jgi:hypothetical protein
VGLLLLLLPVLTNMICYDYDLLQDPTKMAGASSSGFAAAVAAGLLLLLLYLVTAT